MKSKVSVLFLLLIVFSLVSFGQSFSSNNGAIHPQSIDINIDNWQTAQGWKVKDSSGFKVYLFEQPVPEITKEVLEKGIVLVYVRNYDLENPESSKDDKPLATPFYAMTLSEKNSNDYFWSASADVSKISLSVRMLPSAEEGFNKAKNIQLSYLILQPNVIKKHNLTAKAAHEYSYQKIQQLLKTKL